MRSPKKIEVIKVTEDTADLSDAIRRYNSELRHGNYVPLILIRGTRDPRYCLVRIPEGDLDAAFITLIKAHAKRRHLRDPQVITVPIAQLFIAPGQTLRQYRGVYASRS